MGQEWNMPLLEPTSFETRFYWKRIAGPALKKETHDIAHQFPVCSTTCQFSGHAKFLASNPAAYRILSSRSGQDRSGQVKPARYSRALAERRRKINQIHKYVPQTKIKSISVNKRKMKDSQCWSQRLRFIAASVHRPKRVYHANAGGQKGRKKQGKRNVSSWHPVRDLIDVHSIFLGGGPPSLESNVNWDVWYHVVSTQECVASD